jgi:hypothetical protein
MFSDFKEPRQQQFDFSSGARRTTKKAKGGKKKKVMKQVKTTKKVKKVPKTTKKVRKVPKSEVVTLTIPGNVSPGVVKGIGKLCRAFPGRYKLRITVDLRDEHPHAEVDISTEQFVSMDCLKEITAAFPQVSIEPKPI